MNRFSRVNTVKGCEEYVKKYPDLFQGLGSMEGAYHINLQPDRGRTVCSLHTEKDCTSTAS